MSQPDREEPAVVVTKAYDFVLWLLPKVEKFPCSYRFSVGDASSARTRRPDILLECDLGPP